MGVSQDRKERKGTCHQPLAIHHADVLSHQQGVTDEKGGETPRISVTVDTPHRRPGSVYSHVRGRVPLLNLFVGHKIRLINEFQAVKLLGNDPAFRSLNPKLLSPVASWSHFSHYGGRSP